MSAVRRIITDPKIFRSIATLVYPLTTKDAKELLLQKGKEDNLDVGYLGLNIISKANSPEKARNIALILADYFRDAILYNDLSSWIQNAYNLHLMSTASLENSRIALDLEIYQAKRKRDNMKRVLAQYPDSARMEVRQLVNADGAGARFMSPIAQIVAIESQLADLDLALVKLERDRIHHKLAGEFITQAYKLLETHKSGHGLLVQITPLRDQVFRDKDLTNDIVREYYNVISNQVNSLINRYYTDYRFRSGPTLPESKKTKSVLIAALSGLGGFFTLIMGIILFSWLRDNQDEIAPDGSLHLDESINTVTHILDSLATKLRGLIPSARENTTNMPTAPETSTPETDRA